jgi:hypothetical protein
MTEEQFEKLTEKLERIDAGVNIGMPIAMLVIFIFLMVLIIMH